MNLRRLASRGPYAAAGPGGTSHGPTGHSLGRGWSPDRPSAFHYGEGCTWEKIGALLGNKRGMDATRWGAERSLRPSTRRRPGRRAGSVPGSRCSGHPHGGVGQNKAQSRRLERQQQVADTRASQRAFGVNSTPLHKRGSWRTGPEAASPPDPCKVQVRADTFVRLQP